MHINATVITSRQGQGFSKGPFLREGGVILAWRGRMPPLVYPFSQSYNFTPNAFFCSFQVSVQNVQSSLDLHQPEYSNIDQHRDNQKFDSAFVWTQNNTRFTLHLILHLTGTINFRGMIKFGFHPRFFLD